MRHFILVLTVIALVSSAPRSSRIWGGQDAVPGQFPFIVAINDPRQFCDGSIIAPNWILTAAHCLFGLTADVEVYIGSHTNQVGGTAYKILEIITHEDYGQFTAQNDIGLIKINGTLEYSDTVQAIEFGDPVGVNATCITAGWGATETSDFPDILQFVELAAIDIDLCRNISGDLLLGYYLGPEQVCSLAPEGISPCLGDSGGPLICDGKLAGILSYAVTFDCGSGLPNVYTRPVAYADWILLHTQS